MGRFELLLRWATIGGVATACASRAPLPSHTWQASLQARPSADLLGPRTEVRAATPSEPGMLYEEAPEAQRTEDLAHDFVVCRVSVAGDLTGVGKDPDRIVELQIADRTSLFARPNSARWDFSLGLVDLALGDAVTVKVTRDELGDDVVVLQGDTTFTGSPIGWTERLNGVRTSVRCRIPTHAQVERELARRIKRLRRGGPAAQREVAAITGWSDARLSDSQP